MLSSLRKNGLTSLFKEVRVFKVNPTRNKQQALALREVPLAYDSRGSVQNKGSHMRRSQQH